MKPTVAIVALCITAAVLFGVIHDQITARICLEYFTIGHPRIFASNSPTLHALYWGVAATWWVGLIAGGLLAVAARVGRWPKLTARDLWPLIVGLLVVMGIVAVVTAKFSRRLAQHYSLQNEPIIKPGGDVSPGERVDYVVVSFIHAASYNTAFVGTVVVAAIVVVWRWRKHRAVKIARERVQPFTPIS